MPQSRSPEDLARNRDDAQKPGSPPRPSTEPNGAEDAPASPKTATDPATGVPNAKPPRPA